MVGDHVTIELDSDRNDNEGFKGIISEVGERKNSFLRPPMANLDKLFIVISTCEPSPSLLVIDKLIAVCEYKDIEPIIVITKIDLKHSGDLYDIYVKSGFKTIAISNIKTESFDEIRNQLNKAVSAFAGNTGVGKSSLINNMYPKLSLETANISKKLGRGKHTTRHVELYKLNDVNGYVADTPGFGSMEIGRYDIILKDKLQYCFRDFEPYIDKCKFTGCSHTVEKGCAVIAALENNQIMQSRFDSYVAMYNDAKNIKEWEQKV